jgi:peptidoglycan/LPS O-acetylase OafA/YrhL
MNSKYIKSFDGIRAIAIILVILGHARNTINIESDFGQYLVAILGNSGLGVRLFFVLSGYLITILLLKEIKNNNNINIKLFHQKRIIRIFPAFYCFIIVIVILNLINQWNITNRQFLAAVSFTWNYQALWNSETSVAGSWFLGHLWTLALEAQFYLLWPLALALLGIKKSRNLSLIIIILLPFVRIGSYFLFPSQRGLLGMMFHTAIDGIIVGCYMAILNNSLGWKKIISNLKLPIILIILTWLFFLSPSLSYFVKGFGISFGRSLDAIAAGLLIAWLHNNPMTIISNLLSNSVITYVGKISYSLYLWQQLFLTNLNTTIMGKFPYNIGFSFLVAIISYYLVEKPFLRLKSKAKNPVVAKQSS